MSPSIEAAREYLNTQFITGFGESHESFKLIHKKKRLWICRSNSGNRVIIAHICRPRRLLHYMQYRKGQRKEYNLYREGKEFFVGTLADGSFWHTKEISYRCMSCSQKFEGGLAYALKVGLNKGLTI
jgi:hypothetical protein